MNNCKRGGEGNFRFAHVGYVGAFRMSLAYWPHLSSNFLFNFLLLRKL